MRRLLGCTSRLHAERNDDQIGVDPRAVPQDYRCDATGIAGLDPLDRGAELLIDPVIRDHRSDCGAHLARLDVRQIQNRAENGQVARPAARLEQRDGADERAAQGDRAIALPELRDQWLPL
jgi:hypothetical protein